MQFQTEIISCRFSSQIVNGEPEKKEVFTYEKGDVMFYSVQHSRCIYGTLEKIKERDDISGRTDAEFMAIETERYISDSFDFEFYLKKYYIIEP